MSERWSKASEQRLPDAEFNNDVLYVRLSLEAYGRYRQQILSGRGHAVTLGECGRAFHSWSNIYRFFDKDMYKLPEGWQLAFTPNRDLEGHFFSRGGYDAITHSIHSEEFSAIEPTHIRPVAHNSALYQGEDYHRHLKPDLYIPTDSVYRVSMNDMAECILEGGTLEVVPRTEAG